MYKLELSEQHLQIVARALGAMAYDVSAPVIAELQKQIQPQVVQKPKVEEKTE